MAIIKECEICGQLTRDGCNFCERHKKRVEQLYDQFKKTAFKRAVNLVKLEYRGEK